MGSPTGQEGGMTLSKLPSGRWRARVWDRTQHKDVPVAAVLGLPKGTTWETKREARAAREKARERLCGPNAAQVTVGAWWERWTSDPLFSRPKPSTDLHNRERTKAFAARYRDMPLTDVSRRLVMNEWLAGGKNAGTVPALRAMFNDALDHELIDRNPFARLGIRRTKGNRDVDPPREEQVWDLIRAARKLGPPSWAAWLQTAAFTGMRPGELDALRWERLDFERGRISVTEQVTARGGFSLPKNGRRRTALMTPPAREALLSLAEEADFVFVNLRGEHWSQSARAYWWKATRAAADYDGTLYLATRHFAGWYMRNVLGLNSEDVAVALGHTDGGELVRSLYGHLDHGRALDRVQAAYEGRSNVRTLRAVSDG